MNRCKNCNAEINLDRTGIDKHGNPTFRKFCNRSCSASFNNRVSPKRQLSGECSNCDAQIPAGRRKLCDPCRDERKIEWDKTTKGDLLSVGNANGRFRNIRHGARKKYLESDKPQHCVVCGYDKFFDVAHIRECNDFPDNATLAEINHIDNLIALCKNHHWEKDKLGLDISPFL